MRAPPPPVGNRQLERLVGDGSGDRLPIPDTVREVVGQRLGRLSEDAGPILSTAAVIGLTFDLELLVALVDGDADWCSRRWKAWPRWPSSTRWSGAVHVHDAIVRTTLLDGMSATRLALAQPRRVAETIEAVGRPDHDQLALHWQLGGEDKAHEHLELAARRRPRGPGLRVGGRALRDRPPLPAAPGSPRRPRHRGRLARRRPCPPGPRRGRLRRRRAGGGPARPQPR